MLGGMISRECRDQMGRLVETVLEEIGPRDSRGQTERHLEETLRRRWREPGHAVQAESFHRHSRAFLGFIAIAVGLCLGAAARYRAARGLAAVPAAGGGAASQSTCRPSRACSRRATKSSSR